MRILRDDECQTKTGLSRTTRWRMEKRGAFPKRVSLTSGASGYIEAEVDEWIAARIAERDRAA